MEAFLSSTVKRQSAGRLTHKALLVHSRGQLSCVNEIERQNVDTHGASESESEQALGTYLPS